MELGKSLRITRKLRRHKLLWTNLTKVRDIQFDSFSPARYPSMCDVHWQQGEA